jgi:hypothetical protein
VANFVTNLNEKIFVPDNLFDLIIENNAVLNERTNYFKNGRMCPLFVAEVKTESLEEFHLLNDLEYFDRFYKVIIMHGCILIVALFNDPVDDIVDQMEHFSDY